MVLDRDFSVAETQHAEPLTREPSIADGVGDGIMERAVRFDDETAAETHEVDDVGAQGDLASEFQIV